MVYASAGLFGLSALLGQFDTTWDNPAAADKDGRVHQAGLRAGELAAVCGVPDAEFCHNGRFIAGARSLQGALRMAELALAAPV